MLKINLNPVGPTDSSKFYPQHEVEWTAPVLTVDNTPYDLSDFKDVLGYEGRYGVSVDGRVLAYGKTIIMPNGGTRAYPEKLLKQQSDELGYKRVALTKDGKTKSFQVHRLVAIAFINTDDTSLIINHMDGNSSNNHASNLEWCDYSHNRLHSLHELNRGWSTPPRKVGSANNKAVRNEDQVREIRELHRGGVMPKELREMFNICKSSLDNILYTNSWSHVDA